MGFTREKLSVLRGDAPEKPKRRGNYNQGGNQNRFNGPPSKQRKAILILDQVEEPTNTTSIKVLDNMDNEVKDKLPNFRDNIKQAILVELCQKSIAICETS